MILQRSREEREDRRGEEKTRVDTRWGKVIFKRSREERRGEERRGEEKSRQEIGAGDRKEEGRREGGQEKREEEGDR